MGVCGGIKKIKQTVYMSICRYIDISAVHKNMPKIIPSKISKSEREKLKSLLCTKIAKFKSGKQVMNFMEDLLTESELVMIVRRLQIAKMLLEEASYWQIRNELGASHDTIKTVRAKLDQGKGGYLNFIKNL